MMKESKIRIGSRASRLAVAQAEIIRNAIRKNHPKLPIEIVAIETTGDRILGKSLKAIGGKGLFVKELDMALRDGCIDIAVHSLKDMPMEVPKELPILAYGKREDARDVLVYRPGLTALPKSPLVGSSSRRRMLQMQALYQDVRFCGIRGNVQTRLRKLTEETIDATILAAAGLNRLGMQKLAARYFSVEEMIPAAGQGILAIQGRRDIEWPLLKELDDVEARACALAERGFVKELNGGCTSPTAAHAVRKGGSLLLLGLYYREEDGSWFRDRIAGEIQEAEDLGKRLACRMREQGGA